MWNGLTGALQFGVRWKAKRTMGAGGPGRQVNPHRETGQRLQKIKWKQFCFYY